jgi:hypothetical protein
MQPPSVTAQTTNGHAAVQRDATLLLTCQPLPRWCSDLLPGVQTQLDGQAKDKQAAALTGYSVLMDWNARMSM